ncbi:MAG: gluconokinase [Kangiellaceae bacterium]|nr:gluconokinase [Kangiellaceae bacterium]MCW8998504.1 gluconokinase [Kangiellaceae bacterium]MCW9017967.1 gluconokinase [Kangiellaceae bacterium]
MSLKSDPKVTNAKLGKLIVVMGVSGSGKTTIARLLCKQINARFLDADDFHSDGAKAKMAKGDALNDNDRKPWITAIKNYIESRQDIGQPQVLAFSGLKKSYRDELRDPRLEVCFIFLEAAYSIIQERLRKRKAHFFNPKLLTSQFEILERPISEYDVLVVDASSTIENTLVAVNRLTDKYLEGKKDLWRIDDEVCK